jgi:hypothetical protein
MPIGAVRSEEARCARASPLSAAPVPWDGIRDTVLAESRPDAWVQRLRAR